MAKDLKNFAKGRGKNVGGKNMNVDMEDVPEDIRRRVKNLQGKSDGELMSLLMQEVNKGKKDGSFSKESLEEFVAKVSPMLDASGRRRLFEIISKLR